MRRASRAVVFVMSAAFAAVLLCACGRDSIVNTLPEPPDRHEETDALVENVRLNINEYTLTEGEILLLTAVASPLDAVNGSVSWSSSDENIAAVKDGRVTALTAGSVTINAEAGGMTASCLVKVEPAQHETIHVSSVELNLPEETAYTLKLGKTKRLVATVYPENADDRRVIWTVTNPRVATVDQEGLVTAIGSGKTTVVATSVDGEKSASCLFEMRITATGVRFPVHSYSLKTGSSVKLGSDLLPHIEGYGWLSATSVSRLYASSNEKVATIDYTGKVRAIAPGIAVVTVKTIDGKYYDACEISVYDTIEDITELSFPEGDIYMKTGTDIELKPGKAPECAADKTITLSSSDASVVTVDGFRICASAPGSAVITASANGVTARTNVIVTEDGYPAQSYTAGDGDVEISAGEFRVIPSGITPFYALPTELEWESSDTKTVCVYSGGLIRAVAAGTAEISARIAGGEFEKVCSVNVLPALAELVTETAEYSLVTDASVTPVIGIGPEGAKLPGFVWESADPGIATVDDAGCITAVAPGEVNITVTAKDTDISLTFKITVTEKAPATSFECVQSAYTVYTGESTALGVRFLPENSLPVELTWSSADESIVTVGADGVISALLAGETTVSAENEALGCRIEFTVTVSDRPALESISADIAEQTVTEGSTVQLSVVFLPEGALPVSLVWTSTDNAVASVTDDGLVTALTPGQTVIKATTADGLLYCEFAITAEAAPALEGIEPETAEYTLSVGMTASPRVKYLPEGALPIELVYTVMPGGESIIAYSDGTLTALAVGTATLAAESTDGSYRAEFTVNVTDQTETGGDNE